MLNIFWDASLGNLYCYLMCTIFPTFNPLLYTLICILGSSPFQCRIFMLLWICVIFIVFFIAVDIQNQYIGLNKNCFFQKRLFWVLYTQLFSSVHYPKEMYYIVSALSDVEIYMFHFFREKKSSRQSFGIQFGPWIFFFSQYSSLLLPNFRRSESVNHLHSKFFFDIIISRNSRF